MDGYKKKLLLSLRVLFILVWKSCCNVLLCYVILCKYFDSVKLHKSKN